MTAAAALATPTSMAAGVVRDSASLEAARRVWHDLAGTVAGRPRVRVSRDGGRSYPRGRERALSTDLPDQPAAVLIYSDIGEARCLPADFDTSRGGQAQVDRDAQRLQRLIEQCGGQVFTDQSPTGGRHVYVPWSQPVPYIQMRPVMAALAVLLPSLDIQPATNLVAGCIRPPGARHTSGGWQRLTSPLEAARQLARQGNPPDVWQALTRALAPQLQHMPQLGPDRALPCSADIASAAPGRHERQALELVAAPSRVPGRLTDETLRIAREGDYDQARYATPSQARQRVHAAAAAAGWRYRDVLDEIQAGRWPGLWSFYARYSPTARPERLASDWCKAVRWLSARRATELGTNASDRKARGFTLPRIPTGRSLVRKSHTRGPTTHRGATAGTPPAQSVTAARGERVRSGRSSVPHPRSTSAVDYQFIRSWWNAALRAERTRYTGRAGLSRRLVLRAVANAGQKTGSRYLEFGTRSLSLAAGVDHSTVATALRQLRDETGPLLVLLDGHRGVRGDLYELRIPDEYASTIERRDWKPGRFEAIHPVFRELGKPAAFVYEALAGATTSSMSVSDRAMVSHRAAQAALRLLAEHGLALRTARGWQRGPRSPDDIATELGIDELIEAISDRHREERLAWQALLGAVRLPSAGQAPPGLTEAGVEERKVESLRDPWCTWLPELTHPPPADPETVLDLLHRVLGATLVPA